MIRSPEKDRRDRFKACLGAGAACHGITLADLIRERGLREFLIDESLSPSSSKELAVRALSVLCSGDRRALDKAVCNGVVQFLDWECKTPREDPKGIQRIRDLLAMVQEVRPLPEGKKQQQFRRWVVDTWHPDI